MHFLEGDASVPLRKGPGVLRVVLLNHRSRLACRRRLAGLSGVLACTDHGPKLREPSDNVRCAEEGYGWAFSFAKRLSPSRITVVPRTRAPADNGRPSRSPAPSPGPAASSVFEIVDRIHVHRLGRPAVVIKPSDYSMAEVVAIMTGALAVDEAGDTVS
ncbi:putative protein OS=Streptomyces aurantiogriseus OX=66870 GN=GCM10010251_76570 PE=4 SV=1 [Streptomyces aurantiogriseus]|uniref:Uncharacterized protein n=1 Tax=Streptomyces aurantiogriseus TaxID=66870 RepID=A0A918KYI1_9ACTN|nr:hypothetical protein GCM10010251_76570 [Streptomyces aurantiogriseus]